MKYIYLFATLILSFSSCKIFVHLPTEPNGFSIEPGIKSFVIIDGGVTNTPGMVIKRKRDLVVKEVKNQYMQTVSTMLQKKLHFSSITDTTVGDDEKNKLLLKDSLALAKLSGKYSTAIILILKNCYSGFRQGSVKKMSGLDGKTNKIAEYSVFFDTEWIVFQGKSIGEKTVSAPKFHSLRGIESGLPTRGPGFEANKNDILDMAQQNALYVSNLFKY